MRKKKGKSQNPQPGEQKTLESPKSPVIPPVFQRPPMKNTVSPGFKIRQDQRSRFFSRTRRGI